MEQGCLCTYLSWASYDLVGNRLDIGKTALTFQLIAGYKIHRCVLRIHRPRDRPISFKRSGKKDVVKIHSLRDIGDSHIRDYE